MTDPQEALVEALAEFLVAAGGDDPITMMSARQAARYFIEHRRLVALPEEPDEWDVEIADDDGIDWEHYETREFAQDIAKAHQNTSNGLTPTTGRIRPIYRIPGPPIDATEET